MTYFHASIPWVTSAGTLFGIWAVGRRYWWGWLVGLLNQIVWAAFIVEFHAWGLAPLGACLVVLYTKNLVSWRRDERQPTYPNCRCQVLCNRCLPVVKANTCTPL